LLRANNIEFTEYDIDKDRAAAVRLRSLGGRGVPFAIINGQVIRGYSAEVYKRALGLK